MTKRAQAGIAALIVFAILVGAGAGFLASTELTARSAAAQLADLGDGKPHTVSAETLADLSPLIGVAYWAGDRPNTRIELTLTDAAVYLRYLPTTTRDSTKPVLTVATYRNIDGYSSLAAQADTTKARSGAIIAIEKSDPLSTYFAFPRSTFEVEVFSPTSGASQKLVNDGTITPLPSK